MKNLILIALLLVIGQLTFAQKVEVKVDSITTTEEVVTGMYFRVIKTVPDTSQLMFITLAQAEKLLPEAQQKWKYLTAISKVQEKSMMDSTYSVEFRNAMLQDFLSTKKASIEARYNYIQMRSVRDTLLSRSKL